MEQNQGSNNLNRRKSNELASKKAHVSSAPKKNPPKTAPQKKQAASSQKRRSPSQAAEKPKNRQSAAPTANKQQLKDPRPYNQQNRGAYAQQNRPRPKLTKQQLRELQERKRRARSRKITVLVLFLTFYIVLSLIFFALFRFNLTKVSDSDRYSLRILYEDKSKKNLSEKDIYINGVMYIPYSALDTVCEFVLMGDTSKITLILNSSDDYVSFYRDSDLVIAGNTSFRLNSPVYFKDNDYYIPAEFVERCISGLELKYDEELKMYVLTKTNDKLSFLYKMMPLISSINEDELSHITNQNPDDSSVPGDTSSKPES